MKFHTLPNLNICFGLKCIPHKFICWNLNPQSDYIWCSRLNVCAPHHHPPTYVEILLHNRMVLGGRTLGGNKMNQMRSGSWSPPEWDSGLSKSHERVCFPLSALCQMRIQEVSSMQTRRELSAEPDHTGTLIPDLQPPELWERNFRCLCHPVCGIFSWQPTHPKP